MLYNKIGYNNGLNSDGLIIMKNRFKIIILLLISFSFFFVLNTSEKKASQVKTIVVSTFALYDIVIHITQDTLKVARILPFGVEPHEFEPTPKSMIDIEKSALFIYSGVGLEPWIKGISAKKSVVNMSKFVNLRDLHEEHTQKHEAHHHEKSDPHYWLDIENMKKMTTVITEKLIQISPKHRKLYQNNADKYLKMLTDLDNRFKKDLFACSRDTIIMNHNAFGYLAQNYGFHIESLNGLSPDAEANAKNIIRLLKIIKEHNVSTIFYESFVSDKAMKSIAEESGASIGILLPLANISAKESDANASYEQLMLLNLEKLKKALTCH